MLLFGERFASNYAKEAGNDARRSVLPRESNAVALDGQMRFPRSMTRECLRKLRKK